MKKKYLKENVYSELRQKIIDELRLKKDYYNNIT